MEVIFFDLCTEHNMDRKKTAVIAGAGPAGLTVAYELLKRTDIRPVIFEQDQMVGGISRTVEYKGNRMDIGGHRFFSKSDRVMKWWLSMLPLEEDPEKNDRVMLARNRLSRIFHGRKFYDYPIRLNAHTVHNLGLIRMLRIGLSYLLVRIWPVKPVKHLEDFFINRFGRELYRTFFRDYTEKVWGVPCEEIPSAWGAQRIKGLSVSRALWHALRSIIPKDQTISQKGVETSLIDRFLYPKYGPGQLWSVVADEIIRMGGEIHLNHRVKKIRWDQSKIKAVTALSIENQQPVEMTADYFFSTMPVKDLIKSMGSVVPQPVQEVADGLTYRDFITVGLLIRTMKSPQGKSVHLVPDNWIYIQESDVKVGRIQVFNNWSPWLVKDPETVWLGLEYFCQEGDKLWLMKDEKLKEKAMNELVALGLSRKEDYLDGLVVRMPKTYPAYFGSFDRFDVIRTFTDRIENMFLLGRNGMHRYNNQDHSMLTAMMAVDHLIAGNTAKHLIWEVNTEEEYHEEDP